MANKENRKDVLLKAAYDLLKKCDDSAYVKNALAEPVVYGGTEGDGYSLANDIAELLDLEELR